MSNTLTGVEYENVARIGFSAFVDALIPISVFTTDLSAEAATQGTVVKTRIVPAAGTVGDLTDDHTGAYSDALNDIALSEVSITLGSEPVIGFQFSNKEVMQMSQGVWTDVLTRAIKQHARSIANNVLDTLFAGVDTTFTAGVTTSAVNFDADDMWDVREDFVTNAGRMSDEPKTVLNAAYYAALGKDSGLSDRSASGMDVLRTGMIPQVAGFGIVEAPSLAGAAANNTVGFACTPDAMAIAMRAPETQIGTEDEYVAYEVMQDDETGVVMVYSAVFERNYRRVRHYFETLWGWDDGVTTSLRRITSA